MAQQHPTIEFEDVPLDEVRRMSHGAWMNPEISNALKQNIQFLGNAATHLTILDGAIPTTGNNDILRHFADSRHLVQEFPSRSRNYLGLELIFVGLFDQIFNSADQTDDDVCLRLQDESPTCSHRHILLLDHSHLLTSVSKIRGALYLRYRSSFRRSPWFLELSLRCS